MGQTYTKRVFVYPEFEFNWASWIYLTTLAVPPLSSQTLARVVCPVCSRGREPPVRVVRHAVVTEERGQSKRWCHPPHHMSFSENPWKRSGGLPASCTWWQLSYFICILLEKVSLGTEGLAEWSPSLFQARGHYSEHFSPFHLSLGPATCVRIGSLSPKKTPASRPGPEKPHLLRWLPGEAGGWLTCWKVLVDSARSCPGTALCCSGPRLHS